MIDFAHEETDRIIEQAEKRIKKEYKQAAKEVRKKAQDYWKRFELKDKKWRQWVAEGKEKQEGYLKWRKSQLIAGRRWGNLQKNLARDMHGANEKATALARKAQAEAFALNHNYTLYGIEKKLGIDGNFTLYNKDAIERLLTKDPNVLPPPGKRVSKRIKEGKDVLWNRQQLQSVATQGIMQGDSIPHLAKRLAQEVGDKNYKAAVRNARTMVTAAENAGRIEGYAQAEKMGIRLKQKWVAVLDNRTRHTHRVLDGQVVDVGEPFEVEGREIRFPGDPDADADLVYNCRCGVQAVIEGHDIDTTAYRDADIGGMSYEEWEDERTSESRPIEYQTAVGKAIEWAYKRRYRER